jgi:hypothetical protein
MPAETETETIEAPKHSDGLNRWIKGLTSDTEPATAPDDVVGKPAPAAPTPSDKPPELPKPDDTKVTDELPEDKWPRTAQEWKKFKQARRIDIEEREGKIKTLETELTEVRKKITDSTAASPELDTLRKERDELSDRLRILDVERHPKFKSYFETKVKSQVELAKRIVGTEQGESAAKLLTLPDSDYKTQQIEELMLNLTPLQQSRFGGVLNALSEIESERESEIAKGRENYDKMTSEQQSAQQQKVAAVEKQFNDIALRAQDLKDGHAIYQKREGNHEWNSAVEKRLETARNLFFGKNVKVEQVAAAALAAAAMPAILTGYQELQKEAESLKAQIAELCKSSPALGAGTSPSTATSPRHEIRKGTRPDEAISGWVKSLTAEE